jgi:hypothetical protein
MNNHSKLINDVTIKLAKIRFSKTLKQSPVGTLFMDENGYINVDDIINMDYYGLSLTGDAISRLPLDYRGHVVKVIRFDFWESDDELEVLGELQVVMKLVAPKNVTVTHGLIYSSDDKPMLLEEGQWWLQQGRTKVSSLCDVADIMVYTLEALCRKD